MAEHKTEAVFRCGRCKSIYNTQEEADACRRTPLLPEGTKYVVRGKGQARFAVYSLRDMTSRSCADLLSLSALNPFKPHIHGLKSAAFIVNREYERRYPHDAFYPLTKEEAERAIKDLASDQRRVERELQNIKARRAFFDRFLTEVSAS